MGTEYFVSHFRSDLTGLIMYFKSRCEPDHPRWVCYYKRHTNYLAGDAAVSHMVSADCHSLFTQFLKRAIQSDQDAITELDMSSLPPPALNPSGSSSEVWLDRVGRLPP